MMDKGLWTIVIMVGGTFVFIAVAAYFYFYWVYSTITAELSRINKLVLARRLEDAHADIRVLWDRNPTIVDIGCCAVDIAIEAKRYRDAMEHAEVCLQLLEDRHCVNMGYFELLLQQKEHVYKRNDDFLRHWLNFTIIRANFLRCYAEYDYAGALTNVEPYLLRATITPACAYSWKAYFLMLQGHFDEAKAQLEAARLADASDKQYLSIQGHWHLIHGEEVKAVECYRQHQNWASLEEDFQHIQQVFGLKTPERKMVEVSSG